LTGAETHLRVIAHSSYTFPPGAVSTTIELLVGLNTVPYYLATTMFASGRQLLNRALETIKRVSLVPHNHFKRAIVVVIAYFTSRHDSPFVSQVSHFYREVVLISLPQRVMCQTPSVELEMLYDVSGDKN